MGAVSRRVREQLEAALEDLETLKTENRRLRSENGRLVHQCRLAYLEGLDQGQALQFRLAAS